MTHNGYTITEIIKLNFTGKWVEIWDGETGATDNWDFSSKSYMLLNAVEQAGLSSHVHNHGYKGLKVWRKQVSVNLEIEKVSLDYPSQEEQLEEMAILRTTIIAEITKTFPLGTFIYREIITKTWLPERITEQILKKGFKLPTKK